MLSQIPRSDLRGLLRRIRRCSTTLRHVSALHGRWLQGRRAGCHAHRARRRRGAHLHRPPGRRDLFPRSRVRSSPVFLRSRRRSSPISPALVRPPRRGCTLPSSPALHPRCLPGSSLLLPLLLPLRAPRLPAICPMSSIWTTGKAMREAMPPRTFSRCGQNFLPLRPRLLMPGLKHVRVLSQRRAHFCRFLLRMQMHWLAMEGEGFFGQCCVAAGVVVSPTPVVFLPLVEVRWVYLPGVEGLRFHRERHGRQAWGCCLSTSPMPRYLTCSR